MSETRTIKTVIEANTSGYKRGMEEAAKATEEVANALDKTGVKADLTARKVNSRAELIGRAMQGASKDTGALGESYRRAGTALLGFGTTAMAGIGLATKSAMSWESAWAGVRKTVDGSPQQMAEIEQGLRGLAKTLPATHEEIAAVAEAAGQLGVKAEDVVGFTKTMIDLGETTNLSADEAATSLARFSNIMGTSNKDVSRLGSTLVGLGNNFATTEAEIMAMSMRLAGTGRMMHLSEGQVMGLATAMSSVGIEAEAGGTAMSTVMKKINTAVGEGGQRMGEFAKLAGMSADDFAKAWKNDPQKALTSLVTGLKNAGASGQDMAGVLKDLGIKGIREQDTMLRLAGAADLLSDAMSQGNQEFKDNTALLEEAAKRYATTESQMKMAANQIKDAAIDIGGALLPVMAAGAKGVAGVVTAFQVLPAPVKSAVGVLGAAAGGLAVLTGGAMKLVPAVMDTVDSFRRLSELAPGLAGKLGKVGKAMGTVGIAAAGLATVVTTATQISDTINNRTIPSIERLIDVLKKYKSFDTAIAESNLGSTGGVNGGQIAKTSDLIKNLYGGKGLGGQFSSWMNRTIGSMMPNGALAEQVNTMKQLDAVMGMMAEKTLPKAQQQFHQWTTESQLSAAQQEVLLNSMPQFKAQLVGIAEAMHKDTDATTLLKIANGELKPSAEQAAEASKGAEEALKNTGDAADDAASKIDKATDSMLNMVNKQLGLHDAARGFEQALDDAGEAAKKYGKNLDITKEAGRKNQAAMEGIIGAGLRLIQQQKEQGASQEELGKTLARVREEFIKAAIARGMSADEAAKEADKVGLLIDTYKSIPEKIETKFELNAEETAKQISVFKQMLNDLPEYKNVMVNADASGLHSAVDGADLRLTYIEGRRPTPLLGLNASDMQRAAAAAEARLDEISRMKPTPELKAEAGVLYRVVQAAQSKIDSVHGTTVTVKAVTQGESAVKNLKQYIYEVKGKTVTVTVRGNYVGFSNNPHIKAGLALANGGWVKNKGLAAGGWVPGTNPGKGKDNLLWPMLPGRAGGGMLAQPLAGGEYVVNAQAARDWGPALEAINKGGKPAAITAGGVDSGLIANAVAGAIASYQPVVVLGDREIAGTMRRVERLQRR